MTDQEVIELPQTREQELEHLLEMGMAELRVIADRIGAESARSKEDIAANIVARAEEQGIGFKGYMEPVAPSGDVADYAQQAEDEQQETEEVDDEPEASENGTEPEEADLEPLYDQYATRLKHFLFTVGDVGQPDPFTGLYDARTVNGILSRYYKHGYSPIMVFAAGYDTRGQRLGWILDNEEGPKYSESKIIMRTLTANPDPQRGTVTGFQADAYVSSFLEDGWDLLGVEFNGIDTGSPRGGTGGVFMVWFLAR